MHGHITRVEQLVARLALVMAAAGKGKRAATEVAERVDMVNTGDAIDETITLSDCDFETLIEKVDKVNKRGDKLFNRQLVELRTLSLFERRQRWSCGEPYGAHWDVERGAEGFEPFAMRRVYMRDVRVAGTGYKIGDWEMLAALEHTPGGNILRTLDTTADLALHWRTADNDCHHCKAPRARKHTYLMRRAGGDVIQVGRTCLRDFLGVDPQRLLWITSAIARMQDEERDCWASGTYTVDTVEYLCWVAKSVREDGWLSRTAARERCDMATADLAANTRYKYHHTTNNVDKVVPPTDADQERARDATAWARSDELKGGSDYIHNLRLVLAMGSLESKHYGIAASVIGAYARHQERELERRRGNEGWAKLVETSRHLGEVGDKLAVVATVMRIRELVSEWGCTTLYSFETDDGCVVKWFSSNTASAATSDEWTGRGEITTKDLEIGDRVHLRGTVKKHSEYKGVADTALTRCSARLEGVGDPPKVRVRVHKDGRKRTKTYSTPNGAKTLASSELAAQGWDVPREHRGFEIDGQFLVSCHPDNDTRIEVLSGATPTLISRCW